MIGHLGKVGVCISGNKVLVRASRGTALPLGKPAKPLASIRPFGQASAGPPPPRLLLHAQGSRLKGCRPAAPSLYRCPPPLPPAAEHAVQLVHEDDGRLPRRRHLKQRAHQLLALAHPPVRQAGLRTCRTTKTACTCRAFAELRRATSSLPHADNHWSLSDST